jgi:hypothetical protein
VQSELRAQATFTAKASANWDSGTGVGAAWNITSGSDIDGIPDANDNIVISRNYIITVNVLIAECASLSFNAVLAANHSGALVVSSGNTLNVSGSINVNAGVDYNFFGQIYGDGTVNASQILINNTQPSSSSYVNNRYCDLVIGSGTSTATSNPNIFIGSSGITINGWNGSSASVNMWSGVRLVSGVLDVTGTITLYTETANASSSFSTQTSAAGGASAQAGTLIL